MPSCSRDFVIAQDALRGTMYAIWKSRLQNGNCCWHYASQRIPELKMLAQEKRFGFEDVYAEWPDVVAGRRPGRESPDEVIVYIALGIWGEYAAILPAVYRRALTLGLGQRLSL